MKFTINGLEVEIKAKGIHDDKFNKVDLGYFLTDIALWTSDAAKYCETIGCDGMATEARKVSEEIHNQMKDAKLV